MDSLIDLSVPIPGPRTFSEFDTSCTLGCTLNACSCTAASVYWSSTTFTLVPDGAWVVGFLDGLVSGSLKNVDNHVRAVRTIP